MSGTRAPRALGGIFQKKIGKLNNSDNLEITRLRWTFIFYIFSLSKRDHILIFILSFSLHEKNNNILVLRLVLNLHKSRHFNSNIVFNTIYCSSPAVSQFLIGSFGIVRILRCSKVRVPLFWLQKFCSEPEKYADCFF